MSSGSEEGNTDANVGTASTLAALRSDLRIGLRTYLPYTVFAIAVVLCSMPVGGAISRGAGELSWFPFTGFGGSVFAQEGTVVTLVGNEMDLFSLLVIGAVSFGALTLLGLIAQGVIAGYLVGTSLGSLSPGWLFLALVPHGLPKLLGFALAAAISFRLVVCGFGVLLGARRQFLDSREWRQTGLVLGCAWLSLFIAALVEAHVTFRLIGFLS